MLSTCNSTDTLEIKVAVVMGSQSDWSVMQHAANVLTELQIIFEVEIISAHRTPDKLFHFATCAKELGFYVIIAGAGGAAHLPGMIAAKTVLPVLGVPLVSTVLNGVDSLYSIVQMPRGVPVGTLAIGAAGATNAALLAAQIIALNDTCISERLTIWRTTQTNNVLNHTVIRQNT